MVKCPGVIGWKANARTQGWTVWENAPLLPGGGGWAQLELTDALLGQSTSLYYLWGYNKNGVGIQTTRLSFAGHICLHHRNHRSVEPFSLA